MSFHASTTLLAVALSFLVSISNAYVIPAHLTKRAGISIDESKVKAGLLRGFLLYGGVTLGLIAVFGLVMYFICRYFGKKETEAAKRRVTERLGVSAGRFWARNVEFEMVPLSQAAQQPQQEPTRPSPAVLNSLPRRNDVLETIDEELGERTCPGPRPSTSRPGDRTRR